MSEEKKETPKEDKVYERKKYGHYVAVNNESMKKCGWGKLVEGIAEVPENIVPIKKDVKLQGVKNPLVAVFIGFSTRKLYEALEKHKKTTKYVCIIEPNIGSFKHLVCTEDISDLIERNDVDFILGINDRTLINALFKLFTKACEGEKLSRSTMLENLEIIIDVFQYEKDMAKAKELMGYTSEAVNQVKLALGCSDDQFRRFELVMENKEVMYNSWSMADLYAKFENVPCFVLGGGPSLNEFINEYKANPKLSNAFIIAVDAVLHRLLSVDIKPHLVVRCERKLTNIFHGINKEMTKGIYFCAYPWTDPEFFKLFDDIFYLFRHNGACMFTEIKSHSFVDGGVSSGNASVEIACELKCKNIFLAGLDLCFIDGKTHVDGTQVEFDINKSKAKHEPHICNDGQTRTTIPVWKRVLNELSQSLEKHLMKNKDMKIYNLSEKGLVIPLTEKVNLKDKLDVFNESHDIKSMIDKYKKKLPQKEIEAFKNKIKVCYDNFKDLKNLVVIADNLALDAKRTCDREIEKLWLRVINEYKDPYETICIIRKQKANYDKLLESVAAAYDLNFKNKCYNNDVFVNIIFDVLQLDLYQYYNQVNKLINNIDFQDERFFQYYKLTKDFTVRVKYYLEKFIDLFEKHLPQTNL